MSTRDLIITVFMVVGAILVGLVGLGIADHYKDSQFFPLGICSFLIGRILEKVWTA